jgi:small-conductance mechanosensitive channel
MVLNKTNTKNTHITSRKLKSWSVALVSAGAILVNLIIIAILPSHLSPLAIILIITSLYTLLPLSRKKPYQVKRVSSVAALIFSLLYLSVILYGRFLGGYFVCSDNMLHRYVFEALAAPVVFTLTIFPFLWTSKKGQ